MKKIVFLFIRLYQFTLSPFIGNQCRFFPSCSNYALEALQKYSLPKALFYTVKRLLKCGPWHPGGFDPP